jgi:large subunit ribosomal protein L19
MPSVIEIITNRQKKHQVVDVKSGDTVKVHQKIREGAKERIQIFEGLVIRTDRKGSLSSSITVRRIASGVGVEKSYLLHSPLVMKIEVTKRSKVRRNYLTYMRARSGKSARLSGQDFDKAAINTIEEDPAIAAAEAELKAKQEADHEAEMAEKAKAEAAEEAKASEALKAHDEAAKA